MKNDRVSANALRTADPLRGLDGAHIDVLMSELLLTREEAARVLRVKSDTLENLHRTGQLVGVKVGKHLRWRPSDVRRFVEKLNNDERP